MNQKMMDTVMKHEFQYEYHLRQSTRGKNKSRKYHQARANEHFAEADKLWKTLYPKNNS